MAPAYRFLSRRVFVNGAVMLGPAALIAPYVYYNGGTSANPEKQEEIEKRYAPMVNKAKAQNKDLQDFFDKMKAKDPAHQDRLDKVLKSGKAKDDRAPKSDNLEHVRRFNAAKAEAAGGAAPGGGASDAAAADAVNAGAKRRWFGWGKA